MTELHPIRNREELDEALVEIERLWPAAKGSPDSDRMEVLAVLVEDFENKLFPERLPSPIDAIRFRMDQMGWTPKELEPILGSRTRVWEILNEKRPLTLPMIQRLIAVGIPASALLAPEPKVTPMAAKTRKTFQATRSHRKPTAGPKKARK